MARQEPVQPLPEAQSTVLVPLVVKPVVVVPPLVSTWLALDTLVQEARAFDRAVLLPEPWLAVLRRQVMFLLFQWVNPPEALHATAAPALKRPTPVFWIMR